MALQFQALRCLGRLRLSDVLKFAGRSGAFGVVGFGAQRVLALGCSVVGRIQALGLRILRARFNLGFVGSACRV